MCTNNDQMNDSMCYSNSTLRHDAIITSLNKITRNNITMKLSLSLMHFRCSTTLGYGDEDSDSLQHLDDWTENITCCCRFSLYCAPTLNTIWLISSIIETPQ